MKSIVMLLIVVFVLSACNKKEKKVVIVDLYKVYPVEHFDDTMRLSINYDDFRKLTAYLYRRMTVDTTPPLSVNESIEAVRIYNGINWMTLYQREKLFSDFQTIITGNYRERIEKTLQLECCNHGMGLYSKKYNTDFGGAPHWGSTIFINGYKRPFDIQMKHLDDSNKAVKGINSK